MGSPPTTPGVESLAQRLEELPGLDPNSLAVRILSYDIRKLERQLVGMDGLVQVAQEVSRVTGAMDIDRLVSFVLTKARELVGAERGLIVLVDRETKDFEVVGAHHLRDDADPEDVALSRSLLGQVIETGRAVVTTNAQDDPRFAQQLSITDLSIRSVVAVPIASAAGVLGALYLDTRVSTRVFDEADLPVLEAFAGITSSAFELLRALEDRRTFHLESVRALVNAVEATDAYTAGHSSRVGIYAQGILRAMGADEQAAEEALIAGYLHDVGKIGIDSAYVHKAGPLTDEEYEEFKQHTVIGEKILGHARALAPILPAVRWHHERMDGRGYPDGIEGPRIPLLARVICVADSFDAMTSHRVYRPSLGLAKAIEQLEQHSGTQFDPMIARAFIMGLDKGIIRFLGDGA